MKDLFKLPEIDSEELAVFMKDVVERMVKENVERQCRRVVSDIMGCPGAAGPGLRAMRDIAKSFVLSPEFRAVCRDAMHSVMVESAQRSSQAVLEQAARGYLLDIAGVQGNPKDWTIAQCSDIDNVYDFMHALNKLLSADRRIDICEADAGDSFAIHIVATFPVSNRVPQVVAVLDAPVNYGSPFLVQSLQSSLNKHFTVFGKATRIEDIAELINGLDLVAIENLSRGIL